MATASSEKLYTNPRVLVLSLDAMLVMIGFGIIAPSMAFYLLALEGALSEPPSPDYVVPDETTAQFAVTLGLMMAAFMGTRTLLARYWGGVSDIHGRRPMILVGLSGYVLLLVLFGIAQNWFQLVLIRALQGVVSAMVWPVAEASLMDIVGFERRGEGLGIYNAASNLGFVMGPGLGGVLYNICRDVLLLPVPDVFRVPYFIGAAIVLPAVLLTALVLPETAPRGRIGVPKGPSIESLADDPPQKLEWSRAMQALYLMAALNGVAMGLGQPIFQLFLMSRVTTDIGLIGLLISGAGAVGVALTIPAGRLSDRYGRKGIAVWGGACARGSLMVMPLARDLTYVSTIWVLQSATISMSQPAMMALQADIVPWKLRGKLFGTLQAFFNLGATLGPLVGGFVYSVFSLVIFGIGPLQIDGVVVPFWLAGGIGLIGTEAVRRYVPETRGPTRPLVRADGSG
ncbi:MAG: MFS transporter [Candidatus Thorarchaeota archaeon]